MAYKKIIATASIFWIIIVGLSVGKAQEAQEAFRKQIEMLTATGNNSIYLEDDVGFYELKIDPANVNFQNQETVEILSKKVHVGNVTKGIEIRMKSKNGSLKTSLWSSWIPINEAVGLWTVVEGSGELPSNFKNTKPASRKSLRRVGIEVSSLNETEELIKKELEMNILSNWRLKEDVFVVSSVSPSVDRKGAIDRINFIVEVHGKVAVEIQPSSSMSQADRQNQILAKGVATIQLQGMHRYYRNTIFVRAQLKGLATYEERVNPRWSSWQDTDEKTFEIQYHVYNDKRVEFKLEHESDFGQGAKAFSNIAPTIKLRDEALKMSKHDSIDAIQFDKTELIKRLDNELRGRFKL